LRHRAPNPAYATGVTKVVFKRKRPAISGERGEKRQAFGDRIVAEGLAP